MRKAFRLTQDEFAARMGVAKQTLLRYEKDQRPPAADFLETVCRVYFIDGTWLLTGVGEPFVREGNLEETSARSAQFEFRKNKNILTGTGREKDAGRVASEFIYMAEYFGNFAQLIGANPARGRAFEEFLEKVIDSYTGDSSES